MSDAEMLGTLDPSAEGGTGEGGPEVQVPGLKMDQSELFIAPTWPITDLDVGSGQHELHHDVMVTRGRRQMESGLRLKILVIDRVTILAQDVSQDP